MATAAPGEIAMSEIPPFTFVVVQNIQAQRQAAIEKERQLRRAQALEKDAAAHDDEMEHQVESSEQVEPVHDEAGKHEGQPKRKPPYRRDEKEDDGQPPHIDLTA
jgi:hypothetical protein